MSFIPITSVQIYWTNLLGVLFRKTKSQQLKKLRDVSCLWNVCVVSSALTSEQSRFILLDLTAGIIEENHWLTRKTNWLIEIGQAENISETSLRFESI